MGENGVVFRNALASIVCLNLTILMKPNQVRIGNWLRRADGTIFQVGLEDLTVLDIIPARMLPVPIPLTREWLINYQFEESTPVDHEKWEDGRWYNNIDIFEHPNSKPDQQFSFAVYVRGDGGFKGGYGVKYVHDLQNLYFGITGRELELANSSY